MSKWLSSVPISTRRLWIQLLPYDYCELRIFCQKRDKGDTSLSYLILILIYKLTAQCLSAKKGYPYIMRVRGVHILDFVSYRIFFLKNNKQTNTKALLCKNYFSLLCLRRPTKCYELKSCVSALFNYDYTEIVKCFLSERHLSKTLAMDFLKKKNFEKKFTKISLILNSSVIWIKFRWAATTCVNKQNQMFEHHIYSNAFHLYFRGRRIFSLSLQ